MHAEGQHLANVKLQAETCQGLRATGKGHLRGLQPGYSFVLADYPQEKANREYIVLRCDLDITEIGTSSGSKRTYSVNTKFELHPSNAYYRLPQVTPKPRIEGYEYGVIVAPHNREIWIDDKNRVKIQFDWDRQANFEGATSIWVRVMSQWQGGHVGVITPARAGQMVLVAHVHGDPDRPVVAGFVVDKWNMPPWNLPVNYGLSGIRTQSFGRGELASNHLALDDTQGKMQAQLASDHAQSRLVLGYNTRIEGSEGRQEARGEGFELATNAHGVARANKGLLITTEARDGATAPALDRGETALRFRQAENQHDVLAHAAVQAGAQQAQDRLDIAQAARQQNTEMADTGANGLGGPSKPHLVLASAAGIGTTAKTDTHVHSGGQTITTSGGHTSLSAGGHLLAAAQKAIRLFAYRLGIRIISYAEDIDIQALKKNLNLLAKLDITQSANRITIRATQELMLHGGDSYINLKPGKITVGGAVYEVNAAVQGMPPKPIGVNPAGVPDVQANSLTFETLGPAGKPLSGVDYRLAAQSGVADMAGAMGKPDEPDELTGHVFRTDEKGNSPAVHTTDPKELKFGLHWDTFNRVPANHAPTAQKPAETGENDQ